GAWISKRSLFGSLLIKSIGSQSLGEKWGSRGPLYWDAGISREILYRAGRILVLRQAEERHRSRPRPGMPNPRMDRTIRDTSQNISCSAWGHSPDNSGALALATSTRRAYIDVIEALLYILPHFILPSALSEPIEERNRPPNGSSVFYRRLLSPASTAQPRRNGKPASSNDR
ncbi:hypothetical protein Bbelb_435470, partial [Branchiostoma belcheri]